MAISKDEINYVCLAVFFLRDTQSNLKIIVVSYVFLLRIGSLSCDLVFLGGLVVRNPPANAGDVGSISGSRRSYGEGMATLSSILVWEISWPEEPGGLPFTDLQSWTRLSD